MRITLDIADDVHIAAKDFARRNQKTLGQTLARCALQMTENKIVTLPNALRKQEGI
jgi:hypothetical protein